MDEPLESSRRRKYPSKNFLKKRLFRGMIDQALTNPVARTLVRGLLRAEVLHLGAQRSISDTRRVRFERTSLRCALCMAPIVGSAGVIFHFGVMAHRWCVGPTPDASA